MNRRHFLALGGASTLARGLGRLPGCGVALAAAPRAAIAAGDAPLDPAARMLFADAARAPSSHNTQPWRLLPRGGPDWRLQAAAETRLPVVDPAQREQGISLGAFMAALEVAAAAHGRQVEAAPAEADGALDFRIVPGPPDTTRLAALRGRRTLRRGLAACPVDRALLEAQGSPACTVKVLAGNSPAAAQLRAGTLAAAELQDRDEAVWVELAHWVRWREADTARNPTGLTPATMELPPWARLWVEAFYDADDVRAPAFRARALAALRQQCGEGAGWLVLATPGDTAADHHAAGRSLLGVWLVAHRAGLALHPMSQALELPAVRAELGGRLGLGALQGVLRLGRPPAHLPPVSPRWAPERLILTRST